MLSNIYGIMNMTTNAIVSDSSTVTMKQL